MRGGAECAAAAGEGGAGAGEAIGAGGIDLWDAVATGIAGGGAVEGRRLGNGDGRDGGSRG